ncbi:MAG: efflux RND transporter periplasmic adaptor subunit [Desulfobacteraceae bacterium]|nr:efflux RND transporter periplasmic adaptor subunit [Desulfobacteraceae bacterium]
MTDQNTANLVMANLIHLATGSLKADSLEKAGNTIVNRIHTFVKTERAVLVPLSGRKRIFCVSGDLEPVQDNPFSQAVHEIRNYFKPLLAQGENGPQVVTRDSLPSDLNAPQARKVLEAMGGTNILWIPLLPDGDKENGFALWMERWANAPWTEEEIRLVSHAGVFFENALRPRKKQAGQRSKKRTIGLFLTVLLLLLWLPVHSRINAPVQVVPNHPYYVFAPFNGIVEDLAVHPGENVQKGDIIFRYDTRILEKQLEEARRGVAVARAELARLEGAAYNDENARAKIPVQKLEVERKQAEAAFIKKQLELSEVRTEADGVVVLDDPEALIGASLQTGELVLRVADPEQTKLRVMVPATDSGLLMEGAEVLVRLDSDPLNSIHARVERIGFDVNISNDRIPSVLVNAVWKEKPRVTPGQRGMARIQGPKIFLGLQLFRKPLIALRNLLGY